MLMVSYRCSAGRVLVHAPAFLPQECCLRSIQPIRRCLRATRSGSAALFREWQNLTLCGWKMERSCTAPTRCSSQWGSSTGRRFTGRSHQHAQSQQYHPQHQPSLSKKIKRFDCFQCRGIKLQKRTSWIFVGTQTGSDLMLKGSKTCWIRKQSATCQKPQIQLHKPVCWSKTGSTSSLLCQPVEILVPVVPLWFGHS